MFDDTRAFVTRSFLRAELGLEFRAYDDRNDAELLARLRAWAERLQLNEVAAEGAFTQTFFVDTWGYGEAGRVGRDQVTLSERTDWAKQKLEDAIADKIETLQAVLDADATPEAEFQDGELILHAGGQRLIDRIYLDEGVGQLAERYWRFLLFSQKWRDARALAEALRRPPTDTRTPAARQFIERVDALAQQIADIAALEHQMNERLFALYNLSESERFLVETG